jgi:pimeloyl-ACP methyl ester carboxylesterase
MDDDSAERSRRGHALVAEDVHAIGLIILIGEPDHVMSENLSAIVEGIMKRWFTEATLRHEPYPVRYARQAFQRADQASFATALRMISRFDDGRERRAINTTVRIIAAECDQVVTATDPQSVAACAPNCSLTVVRGANHMLPLEHPERLAELLRDGVQA